MTAFAVWLGITLVKYQLPGRRLARLADRRTSRPIPVGYGVAIIGLLILGVAGPADLIWHSAYGFEVGVDAICQPAAPRAVLRRPAGVVDRHPLDVGQAATSRSTSSGFLPAFDLGDGCSPASSGFITMYLSAFMTNVTPTSDFDNDYQEQLQGRLLRPDDQPHRGPDAATATTSVPYHYYTVAMDPRRRSIITTLVLLGPSLLHAAPLARPGARVHADLPALRPAELHHDPVPRPVDPDPAGHRRRDRGRAPDEARSGPRAATDAGRHPPDRPAHRADALVSYFVVLAVHKGIGWKTPTWLGAIIIGVMAGFGVAFLVAPPSYGPRLVEGGEDCRPRCSRRTSAGRARRPTT